MNLDDAWPGKRVRIDNLDYAMEIAPVGEKYLNARTLGVTGTLVKDVRRHAVRVWWVQHDEGGETAPYCIHEMTLLEDQTPPVPPEPEDAPKAKSIFE